MTLGATKRAGISDEDAFSLLQRYSPTTILTFLKEVSQVANLRIDWNALVKGTATGITNARECQMLWRHLAYNHVLLDKIDDGVEPLDDESDLESEVEVIPTTSSEDMSEVAACVKVLISHGLPHGIGQTNQTSIEAPSAVKAFKEKMVCALPDKQQKSRANHGANITVPCFQKNQRMGTSIQGSELTDSSYASKKKRKLWTIEEDLALIAAEQKFGEGNWVDILKSGSFNFDRTSSQLSQRWSTLKRKYGSNLHASYGIKSASSTQPDERLATRKAISLALDKPKYGSKGNAESILEGSTSAFSVAISEALPVSSQPLNQLKQPSPSTKSLVATLNKSGIRKSMEDVVLSAGGRRVQPSDAGAFIRSTQSKPAVHIRISGGAQPSNSKIKTLAVPSTADKSTQANPVASPSGTKHGGQEVQGSSTDSKNPPSTPSTTLEMTETETGDSISAADANELMAEEVKSAGGIAAMMKSVSGTNKDHGLSNADNGKETGNTKEMEPQKC